MLRMLSEMERRFLLSFAWIMFDELFTPTAWSNAYGQETAHGPGVGLKPTQWEPRQASYSSDDLRAIYTKAAERLLRGEVVSGV